MKTPDGKDINTPSKTPEEIKKWLNGCANKENCGWCPNSFMCEGDKAVLVYIEQLETERDAAVEDIKKAALCLRQTCKKYHPMNNGLVNKQYCSEIPDDPFSDGAMACGMYEWRGVKEERT